jgi:rhodanese-related sulfurtransferase
LRARITVEELLADARAQLERVTPSQAAVAMGAEAVLVDIRSDSQRREDGLIPNSRFIPRNVLEWRLDPTCPYAEPELAYGHGTVILICDQGYQSSLAEATLQRLGVDATDVIGGFQAWRDAGLPVER